jgi:hypothetical protein
MAVHTILKKRTLKVNVFDISFLLKKNLQFLDLIGALGLFDVE